MADDINGHEPHTNIDQGDYEENSPFDPQHPLLKDFAEKARGTFNHSQNLVLLISNITDSISLPKKRADNLKLAATYHDIGKIFNPTVFSENQKDVNIHDNLDPYTSYQFITRHVSDSVIILFGCGFPVDVIRIVSEHHGNTVLRGFYDKAKKLNQDVLEKDFRYKTHSPSCVESMILMLCDVVESTTRSIYGQQGKSPDPEILINNIFDDLYNDGQFDNVEMKLGKLGVIKKTLIDDTGAKFHKREAYPQDEELIKEKNGGTGT